MKTIVLEITYAPEEGNLTAGVLENYLSLFEGWSGTTVKEHWCSPPNSIQEALNSGDGAYRLIRGFVE